MSFRVFLFLCLVNFTIAGILSHESGSDLQANEKSKFDEKSKVDEKAGELHGKVQDSRSYGEKETRKSEHDAGKYSVGEAQLHDEKKNYQEKDSSVDLKKGYHRSGFSKNYHKSESGNNSNFYEDSEDENAQKRHDLSDEHKKERIQDAHQNKELQVAYAGYEKASQGEFGKAQRHGGRHEYIDNYKLNNHGDERRKYLHDKNVERIGRGDYTPLYQNYGPPPRYYPFRYLKGDPYAREPYYPVDNQDYHDNYYDYYNDYGVKNRFTNYRLPRNVNV